MYSHESQWRWRSPDDDNESIRANAGIGSPAQLELRQELLLPVKRPCRELLERLSVPIVRVSGVNHSEALFRLETTRTNGE